MRTNLRVPRLTLVAESVVLLFTCACFRTPDFHDIAGNYVAHYSYGTEELDLRPDGIFVQKVYISSSQRQLETTGKWTFDRRRLRVELNDKYLVDDGFGRLPKDYDTLKPGVSSFPVQHELPSGRLILSQGDSPAFQKQ